VTSTVPLTAVFNSMSQILGSTSNGAANKWIASAGGAGTVTRNSTSGAIVLVTADGATWSFTPVSGSAVAFTSPAGFQATLVAQLTGGTVSGYTLTSYVSQTVEAFDSNGVGKSITDRNGNVTTFGFDGYGHPTNVVSSAGPTAARTATIAYNPTTFTETLSQTNGALTRTVKYIKNSASNLTSIVDAMGNSTAFTYTSGNLTQIISVTGAETDFSYDGTGRITQVDQHNTTSGSPGTSTTRLTYPSAGQTLVAAPNTSTGTAVASGPHLTYTIGAGFLVSKATDQMGRERSATYSPTNLAPATSISGNTDATPPAGSTPTGTSSNTFGANSGQSLTAAAAPGGATRTAAYANTGSTAYLPSSTSGDSGDQTVYHYTGSGNVDSSTNSTLAATAALTYNINGTVATATAPNNAAVGATPANPTTYGYDPYTFQLNSVTPPTGTTLGVKALTYDGFGRLSSITDGRGNTTTYTYDKIDRKLSTAFSSGLATVSNTYNTAGQQLAGVSAAGTISNTYDQLGRLLTTVNTAGGGTETYTYDKGSNLATTTDGLGTITNTYDVSNVLIDMKYPHNSSFQHLVFRTDDQGRRTDQYLQADSTGTYWAGHVHTVYDTSGRIIGLTSATGPAPTTVTPVLDMTYCYNTASPAPTCATGTSTDRSKLQWQKDNLTGQVAAFGYDSGGRLLTVGQSGGQTNNTYTYTYDADGNRKTAIVTGSNPATQSLTFNPGNQITTTGYAYDGAGNLTATPTASYTYNAAEQMTQAVTGGVTSTYTYAGASQSEVLSETRGGSSPISTKLVYGRTGANGQPEIEQYSINGNQAYVFDDPTTGQPLGIVTSADQACMLVFDGTDNPVGLLSNSATVSFTYKYDPWGVQTLTAGGTGNGAGQNPYAFHGGIKDPGSGLVKFGLRWYNPVTGTWTQQDTLDSPLDPANANRYAYAGDDPVNNIDPSGQYLSACTTQAINLAIGAIVLGIGYGGALAAVAAGITAPAGIAAIVTLGSGTGLLLTGYNDYLRDCT
jgi:RHS repeat-associated protein